VTRRFGRRLVATGGLVALAAGVPALLWWLAGWPLPDRLPAPSQVAEALKDGWRPGPAFVVGVLAVTLWLLWGYLMWWVLRETRRALQARVEWPGSPPPPSAAPWWARRLAGWLVGGILAAGPVGAAGAAASVGAPQLSHVLRGSGAMAPSAIVVDQALVRGSVKAENPRYVVRPWADTRDCLWVIAERYLGDPFRWSEIYELNRDRAQPDGRRLGADAHRWVYPGWELLLPADATGDELTWDNVPAPSVAPPVAPTAAAPPTTGNARAGPDGSAGVTSDKAGRAASTVAPRPSKPVPATTAATADRRPENPAKPVRTPARAVLPAVLAGAVLAELARRSLAQHRVRRRGRNVNAPPADTRVIERQLGAIPGTEATRVGQPRRPLPPANACRRRLARRTLPGLHASRHVRR